MAEDRQLMEKNKLRPANAANLEEELSTFWRSAGGEEGAKYPVTRSCSLTLLICSESESDESELLDLVAKIAPQNPCRVVLIVAEPQASPSGLITRVGGHFHSLAAGEKGMCCELVSIHARGDAVNGVDQVVIPLMAPGLPVCLWWRAGHFLPPKYLDLIVHSADRVLVDSARFPNPESDLGDFFDQVRKYSNGRVFADLNWGRLTPWRELIAQCFDSADTRPYLEQLAEVHIEYEQESAGVFDHRSISLLFAGWLASRLKWKPVVEASSLTSGDYSFLFHSRAGTVKMRREVRQFEGAGSGHRFSIHMKAGGDSPAMFILVRAANGETVLTRTEIPGRPPLERSVRLQSLDEIDLIGQEIRFGERDHVYEEALGVIARLTSHTH